MSSYKESILELMYLCSKLSNPVDRVRVTEWIRKLSETAAEQTAHPRLIQEYLDYLKLMCQSVPIYFVEPFKSQPPKKPLVPLAEALGDALAARCPYLPKSGPAAPMVLHRSGDDTASMSVHKDANGEIFCYMSIVPRDV
ncbi:uncharacterized protein LOC129764196 [Toxorhynchites rutilus septentrionalis]|uniref:uncharacterized protein LOC129764196 n=1 Tax=Toxorhynchites rutilus septentrionalis TaxID=329112 RepID=UPI002478F2F3|nr:uncharacterized protein LOC129764196 [Toxorhynchites rutilus septentrionalis]